VENKETISDLVKTMENAEQILGTPSVFASNSSLPSSPEGSARVDELLR
jgi:hypothetical protein